MVNPSNIEEAYQSVEVIDQERNNGSDDPKTVALENSHKKSSGQPQTNPSVKNKQIEDVSIEEEQETEAACMEGVQAHSTLPGEQVNCIYEGEKLLRGNVSDAFILGENHGPESVKEEQETEAASTEGVQAHSTLHGEQVNCIYEGEKLLRGNVSDAFILGENHGPESVKGKNSKMKRKPPENMRRFKKKRKMTGHAKSRNRVSAAGVTITANRHLLLYLMYEHLNIDTWETCDQYKYQTVMTEALFKVDI
ncbi:hypothetical protein HOLleu_37500 [Holothuria leucospilota]|uniref:Uncharacterized protein n=1 Tax=Holothuria leucospilota TaxID=206669 RepID=A0A9Q0YNY5_HOLLE|nr:hypothetical protein HOLleu_37500 [Holothuria leucospilota]